MSINKFGDSPIDRRRARADAVSADEHHALSRRVDDHGDRLHMLEVGHQQIVDDAFNLRQELSAIVESNTSALLEFSRKSSRQEYFFTCLTFVNVIVIIWAVLVIATHL
jgi:hypothetical protein